MYKRQNSLNYIMDSNLTQACKVKITQIKLSLKISLEGTIPDWRLKSHFLVSAKQTFYPLALQQMIVYLVQHQLRLLARVQDPQTQKHISLTPEIPSERRDAHSMRTKQEFRPMENRVDFCLSYSLKGICSLSEMSGKTAYTIYIKISFCLTFKNV